MKTERMYISQDTKANEQAIRAAAALLNKGETVAFPTETVYGLGADATNETAVRKIFEAKERPQDNPLIAHVANVQQLASLVEDIPPYVEKLISAFSPGPITYTLRSNGTCAANVTAGLSTIGVRIPNHPVALELLEGSGIPIAAPSANLSGKPSPTTADHVWEDLNGKIAGLLDGGPTGVGVESTVLDCSQSIPIILRPGGISKEQIEAVTGVPVMTDPGLAGKQKQPKAPGMKYRHYAPEVPMWLVEGSANHIQSMIDANQEKGLKVAVLSQTRIAEKLKADEIFKLGETIEEVAAHIYDALRRFKQSNVDIIICETFPQNGIGSAVMNRLTKAASKYVKA